MTWSNVQYTTNTGTSTGTWIYPTVTSASSNIGFSTAYTPVLPPAPKPAGPLEWLDAEIERTCAKARLDDLRQHEKGRRPDWDGGLSLRFADERGTN